METLVSPLLQPAGLVVGFLAALFLGISQQKRLGGCCDWNGRTEKRKAHRIFVCHLAISTSFGHLAFTCSSSGSRFNLRDTSWKGCADGPTQ
jgi:hypothetical protein